MPLCLDVPACPAARRLQALPIPRLCPRGFVMVWVHKGLIQPCCRLLAGWGYVYVENLTWVHLTPGNAIARGPGAHFCRSHSTLLMFRKEGTYALSGHVMYIWC